MDRDLSQAGTAPVTTRTALASVLLAGAVAVGLLYAPSKECASCRTVSNEQQLLKALTETKPLTRINLAAGAVFGEVVVDKVDGRNVTIASADPAKPATFQSLTFRDSRNFTLRDVVFDRPVTGLHYKLLVMDSKSIAMDGLTFAGDDSAYDDDNSFSAVMIRQSHDIQLTHSRIEHFVFGATVLDDDGVKLEDNAFLRMKEDGIRGGGTSNLVIRRNQVRDSDSHPRGHPDGIQLWTTNTHAPAHDILIEDNLIMRGVGGATQGVFVNDEDGYPYQRIVIRGNLVTGGLYNGVTLTGAQDGEMTGNTVIPAPDQESWVIIDRADGVTVRGNRAGQIKIKGKPIASENGAMTATSRPDDQVTRWLNEKRMTLAR